MGLLTLGIIVSLAVLQNIDNFVLAAAYRLKNVVIPMSRNLLIGVFSGIATGVPVALASGLRSEAIQVGLNKTAGLAGRGILLMLGVWTLVGYFRSRLFPQLRDEESDHHDNLPWSVHPIGQPAPMRTSEAVIAGTALAVDNLAPSFAFGLIDPFRSNACFSGLLLGVLSGGFSVLAVVCGQIFGRRGRAQFQRILPPYITPELISGVILICIAIVPFDIDDWAADFLKLR
jgi:putative Mn2+ efflux pump MntP